MQDIQRTAHNGGTASGHLLLWAYVLHSGTPRAALFSLNLPCQLPLAACREGLLASVPHMPRFVYHNRATAVHGVLYRAWCVYHVFVVDSGGLRSCAYAGKVAHLRSYCLHTTTCEASVNVIALSSG